MPVVFSPELEGRHVVPMADGNLVGHEPITMRRLKNAVADVDTTTAQSRKSLNEAGASLCAGPSEPLLLTFEVAQQVRLGLHARMTSALPKKLYKYRPFNVFCLRLLTHGEIRYSDPRTFNDPLDCNPTIEVDIDRSALEHLCYAFLRSTQTAVEAKAEINNYRKLSTEHGDFRVNPSVEGYLKRLLAAQIKTNLDQELGGSGVLSLAARWDCVLMWSHYADNHRGVCVEFDLTEGPYPNLGPVNYRAARRIKTSDLFEWKRHGSPEAEKRVRDTYYFAKAGAWSYEKEWRDITPISGPQSSNLRVTALHFGLQCDTSVMHAIVKLLDGNQDVELYDIYPRDDSFRLKRTLVDRKEFESRGMRQPAWSEFKDLFLADESNGSVERSDPSGEPLLAKTSI